MSSRWAELIYRIYEIDSLDCPRCGARRKILGFIIDPKVIRQILDHLDQRPRPRAPPGSTKGHQKKPIISTRDVCLSALLLHGSPQTTFDADICPARGADDLEKLAAALREMKSRIRTPDIPSGLAFTCDASFLQNVEILNLVTAHGDLDLTFVPSGTRGYEDLAERAQMIEVKGYAVPVASIEDIIRSKEAANRPKDLAALPILRQLQSEMRKKPT